MTHENLFFIDDLNGVQQDKSCVGKCLLDMGVRGGTMMGIKRFGTMLSGTVFGHHFYSGGGGGGIPLFWAA